MYSKEKCDELRKKYYEEEQALDSMQKGTDEYRERQIAWTKLGDELENNCSGENEPVIPPGKKDKHATDPDSDQNGEIDEIDDDSQDEVGKPTISNQ